MPRFAQIEGTRVNWVFTAPDVFPHAPSVLIVDITNVVPAPQEGWTYNPQDGSFTAPPTPAVPPTSALKTAFTNLLADPAFAALAPSLKTVFTEWNKLLK